MRLYIDFEFNGSNGRWLKLICASCKVGNGEVVNVDLREKAGRAQLRNLISSLPSGTVLVSYGVSAEVRALMSLYRVNHISRLPIKKFICLHREHKLLANRCVHTTWGKMLDASGRRFNRRFRGGDREEEKESKKYINLLNALFKFLGVEDEEHHRYKELYRNMCIRGNGVEIARNIEQIMAYCEMDVNYLPALDMTMHQTLRKRQREKPLSMIMAQQLFRGWYGALIAQKEQIGYCIDYTAWVNLENCRARIIRDMAQEINNLFPTIQPFGWSEKEQRFILSQAKTQAWIEKNVALKIKNILGKSPKTKKWQIQKDVLERIYSGVKDNLPTDDLLAQLYRWLRLASAMRGLDSKPSKNVKKLVDYMDRREGVVRPHYNDYGTQTGRSAPGANGYLLLKPPWVRSLLVPPPGHYMVAVDYGKQEVLYLAVMSQDQDLIKAYASGDPYVVFGMDTGILYKGMDRMTWSLYRQACKQIVLSVLYGITSVGLSAQLSLILKREVGRGEAEKYLLLLKRRYPVAMRWMGDTVKDYVRRKSLELQDGWTMWGGNTNDRSISNWRIQGGCSYVMRLVDWYAWHGGVHIPMTLHDGFYFYVPQDNPLPDMVTVLEAMHRGFVEGADCLPGSDLITIDIGIYGEGAESIQDEYVTANGRQYKIEKKMSRYIDDRGIEDLKRYGGYLWPNINKEKKNELESTTNTNTRTTGKSRATTTYSIPIAGRGNG